MSTPAEDELAREIAAQIGSVKTNLGALLRAAAATRTGRGVRAGVAQYRDALATGRGLELRDVRILLAALDDAEQPDSEPGPQDASKGAPWPSNRHKEGGRR